MTTEVAFEPVDGPINDLIDDAYRAKYRGSPYLNPMVGARARSATIKVMPREQNKEFSVESNEVVHNQPPKVRGGQHEH
jgi:hypothetical protein